MVSVVDYLIGGLALDGTYGIDLRGLAECCQIFGGILLHEIAIVWVVALTADVLIQ